MMNEWSLDVLYKGLDDLAYANDMETLQKTLTEMNDFVDSMSHENEKETLVHIIELQERLLLSAYKLSEYLSLRQSTNTKDADIASELEKVMQLQSRGSKAMAAMNRFVAETKELDACIEADDLLKEYSFYLHELKENGAYLLSNEVEEVLTKMDISGGNAWGNLQSYLTSTLEVDYNNEKTNLSHIRNLAYDSDAQVRKSAYEAELASYQKIRDAIAFSLNNIKAQVITECDLRGYESPLDMTLKQSRMQKATLDAMLCAMKEYMPIFHKYLRRKAELLGHKNGLPWYDLFAPLPFGTSNKKFSVEDAKQYLISHFRPFAPDMADMMEKAFDEKWIDFFPRNGKVGGAFCANLQFAKQSRILTNFDGGLGDIVTLAHELGHAYHGMMSENHRPLNWDYSMPVAETASTFNENIIMNALIEESEGDEKIALMETQLQDLAQIMCDIYSRYVFESEVFNRKRNGFMFPDELEAIMLDAQKQGYGDGLDENYMHPYMWICKSHYYSSHLSFYNFPYAFGGLFARGLIVKYKELGDGFVEKYRKLLNATTVSSVEDVARIADIDLTDVSFWRSALETCKADIESFLAATESKLS
ncbi:M3 family oligoendopeptidase [Amedibacillus dolichus]|uniref:M3 family oligoendopeptidase n=1 Tax=Amedibacillus dolichus TaxID=31971 RepID=UPI003C6C02D2